VISDIGFLEIIKGYRVIAPTSIKMERALQILGDTITIDSVAYKIREIRPDGTGMTELIIEV